MKRAWSVRRHIFGAIVATGSPPSFERTAEEQRLPVDEAGEATLPGADGRVPEDGEVVHIALPVDRWYDLVFT